jgi:hypothetical protein
MNCETPPVKRDYPPGIAGTFEAVLDHLRNMTSEEFRQSLRDYGIIGPDGKLDPEYRTPKPKKKIRRAPRRKPRSKFL